jgi:hypothetical protein
MKNMKNNLVKIIVLSLAALIASSCGGKSDATGEVVPIDGVCRYEKWKTVGVEGYLAPKTMVCEQTKNRRGRGGISNCTFLIYANSDRTGASIPVEIMTTDAVSANNNRMDDPPSRLEDLKIYDNDGNPISLNDKIRVFGTLPKAERCDLGLAQRIERAS